MFRTTIVLAAAALVVQVNCHGDVISRLEVSSEVGHRYAVTYVTAAVTNSKSSPSDLKFKMTLPWSAFVSTLTIESNGKNYTTVVRERRPQERRRPEPNTSSDSSKKSGTKKIKTTQTFKASASVGAKESAVFYLKYEELLQRVKGRYTHRLYLRPANKIRLLEVNVRISETENITDFEAKMSSKNDKENVDLAGPSGVQQTRLSPFEILLNYREENITVKDRDVRSDDENSEDDDNNTTDENKQESEEEREGVLTLSYDVDRQADGGEIQILGGFFVHYFCPEGLPKLPTHTVFVLDISGSMYDFGKLDQLKLAMESILHSMKPDDSFEVLVFSTRVTSLGVFTATPKDVERGVTKIKRLHAMGGTNFNEALLKAILEMNNFNQTTAAKQVVFLTDGKPNLGETKSELLRRNVREANIHSYPIFSLAFGGDADMRLLRQVSTDNRGFTRKIDAHARPADQLKDFYEEIATPLITDVDVMYLDDEVEPNSVVRQGTSTYYSGDEVVLAGQLAEGATQVRPIITGQGRTGPMQFRVSRVSKPAEEPERDNYVERLWAYLTVQDLLSMQEVVEDSNLRAEMRARALDIAVRFQFLTKLTSLDIVEDSGGHPSGYKSAALHQKSNSVTIRLPNVDQDLTLLSAEEFAKTLPAPLHTRVDTQSRRRFSFGDNDPHFVVQVPGVHLPLCFDLHGQDNDVFSLVRDDRSGIIVNGVVTSSADHPELTYFTKIFISLGKVNFTVTPHRIVVDCLDDAGKPKVNEASTSLWPFKRNPRKRRVPRLKSLRRRRKVRRQLLKRIPGGRRRHASKRESRGRRKRRKRPTSRRKSPSDNRPPTSPFPQRVGLQRSRQKRDLLHPHKGKYPFSSSTERDSGHPHAYKYPPRPHRKQSRHAHSSADRHEHTKSYKQSLQTRNETSHALATETPSSLNSPEPTPSSNTSDYTSTQSTVDELVDNANAPSFSPTNSPSLLSTSTPNPQRNSYGDSRGEGEGTSDGEVLGEDEDELILTADDDSQDKDLQRECSESFAWSKASGGRYGQVVVGLRNHRKLEILLGDVDAHFVVTRSKNKHGQQFLGFYVEEQTVLTPNTTGVIGQFAFKTVGTLDNNGTEQNANRVKLAVIQPETHKQYKVSQINAFVSSRRSLLHKTHVTCLFIRNQGRGLLAGEPEDYLRPCLTC
ncbi:inter-alpha-trypsin inhibitor heavy chain H5-like [Penaeus japonicus]|uniref:inter-alpha-trypsin inhibitor heavy chain H5-like n=1 Tax=Penaeus japonicus TaxID=27405 RepID=UPI001C70D2BB|nr:inter-alpha-trypsin inhibitor heavy chain H5-like [Penaeus japonicus]